MKRTAGRMLAVVCGLLVTGGLLAGCGSSGGSESNGESSGESSLGASTDASSGQGNAGESTGSSVGENWPEGPASSGMVGFQVEDLPVVMVEQWQSALVEGVEWVERESAAVGDAVVMVSMVPDGDGNGDGFFYDGVVNPDGSMMSVAGLVFGSQRVQNVEVVCSADEGGCWQTVDGGEAWVTLAEGGGVTAEMTVVRKGVEMTGFTGSTVRMDDEGRFAVVMEDGSVMKYALTREGMAAMSRIPVEGNEMMVVVSVANRSESVDVPVPSGVNVS